MQKKREDYRAAVLEKFEAGTISKEECETLLAQTPTSDAVKYRSYKPNCISTSPLSLTFFVCRIEGIMVRRFFKFKTAVFDRHALLAFANQALCTYSLDVLILS